MPDPTTRPTPEQQARGLAKLLYGPTCDFKAPVRDNYSCIIRLFVDGQRKVTGSTSRGGQPSTGELVSDVDPKMIEAVWKDLHEKIIIQMARLVYERGGRSSLTLDKSKEKGSQIVKVQSSTRVFYKSPWKLGQTEDEATYQVTCHIMEEYKKKFRQVKDKEGEPKEDLTVQQDKQQDEKAKEE